MARKTLKEVAEQLDDFMAKDDNGDILDEDEEEQWDQYP